MKIFADLDRELSLLGRQFLSEISGVSRTASCWQVVGTALSQLVINKQACYKPVEETSCWQVVGTALIVTTC